MNTLSIIALVVAAIWTIADIIYYVITSEMKADAENEIKRADAIKRGNESQLAHISAQRASLSKKEDQVLAAENQIKRKWADLEKAQKEYADNLAELKKRESVCDETEKAMAAATEMCQRHIAEKQQQIADIEEQIKVKQSELDALKKKGAKKQ